MKWHEQVTNAVSKASKVISVLRKKLISTYVRPHVEFAVPVWSPQQRGDVRVIEKVMRRATKIPGRLRDLSYVERCERLGFTDLETRRRRGDLIQQFKIAKNIDRVEFVAPNQTSTPRGNKRAKLIRELVRGCDQRHNFFANRIANLWNGLDDSTVTASNVNEFKNRLDEATRTRLMATTQGDDTHRG